MGKISFEQFILNVGLAQAEKMNTCHDDLGQFCSGGGSQISQNIDESLAAYRRIMREQFSKNPKASTETSPKETKRINDMGKALSDIQKSIREIDSSGELSIAGNMVNLVGSDKFAMLGISVQNNGSIELRQLYMRDNQKGKGPQGPASKFYRALGKIAENYGDGKLHVYSPGEYTKQKKFWDQISNASIE